MEDEIRFRNPVKSIGYSLLLHVCGLDPQVSGEALKTYLVYLFYAQQSAKCWPSRATIAQMRGVKEVTISRHNAELERAGYITRERRMSQSSITWIEDLEQIPRLKELAKGILLSRIKNDMTDGSNMIPPSYQKRSEEELTIEELTTEELTITADLPPETIILPEISGEVLLKPEPVREAIDEEGRAIKSSGRRAKAVPAWALPDPEDALTRRALAACGRKKFGNKVDRALWDQVLEGTWPDENDLIAYPPEWLEFCINWAEKKAQAYRQATGRHGGAVKFSGLLSFITNEEKRNEWHVQEARRLETGRKNGKAPRADMSQVSFPSGEGDGMAPGAWFLPSN